jgi:hypothetical protein
VKLGIIRIGRERLAEDVSGGLVLSVRERVQAALSINAIRGSDVCATAGAARARQKQCKYTQSF